MALDARNFEAYKRALVQRGYSEAQASEMAYQYMLRHTDQIKETTTSHADSLAGPAVTALALDNIIGGSAPEIAGETIIASTPTFAIPEFSLGAGEVTQAALSDAIYGAGTTAGGEAAASSLAGHSIGGELAASSAGYSAIPGLIGAGLALDVLANKKHGASGALEGALAGGGIGWTFGGPVGAAIGAPIGAGIGYFGNFGDEDKYLTEYNRAQALRDQGVNWMFNTIAPTSGRSKDELVEEATRNVASGKYGNPEFERTRDEKLLRPEDIMGNAVFGERFGADWFEKFTDSQRRQIAQAAINQGLVREHHGTIDVEFGGDFDAQIQRILAGEETVETTPFEPQGQAQYPREQGPTTIVVNMGGGGSAPRRSANAEMTTQAMINMGLSNDEAVNLISHYKGLGALTPNEAAEAAYTVGKMRGSM